MDDIRRRWVEEWRRDNVGTPVIDVGIFDPNGGAVVRIGIVVQPSTIHFALPTGGVRSHPGVILASVNPADPEDIAVLFHLEDDEADLLIESMQRARQVRGTTAEGAPIPGAVSE